MTLDEILEKYPKSLGCFDSFARRYDNLIYPPDRDSQGVIVSIHGEHVQTTLGVCRTIRQEHIRGHNDT